MARGFSRNEGNSIYFHKPPLFSNGLSLVRTLAAVNLVAACIANISSSNLKLSASCNDREVFYTPNRFQYNAAFQDLHESLLRVPYDPLSNFPLCPIAYDTV